MNTYFPVVYFTTKSLCLKNLTPFNLAPLSDNVDFDRCEELGTGPRVIQT